MRIVVRDIHGNSLSLNVSSGMTVGSVKAILALRMGIDPGHHKLTFRGTVLQDDMALKDCAIHPDDMLLLAAAPPPRDPRRIEEMIQSPRVQSILRTNLAFFTEAEVSEIISDYLESPETPELLRESHRLADLALDQLEVTQSGLAVIARNYADFENSGLEAALFNDAPVANDTPTVIGEPLTRPSEDPFPSLFTDEFGQEGGWQE
jgi:hypothetical protein